MSEEAANQGGLSVTLFFFWPHCEIASAPNNNHHCNEG